MGKGIAMNNQWIVSFGEFLDRFAYYGFISVYILLAISFTSSSSTAIKEYSLYATFGFSLPTILGYFSDKWGQHYMSHQPNVNLGLICVSSSLFFIGLADFLIVPSILSYLSLFSLDKIKSALYSLWFISISLSAYISTLLFNTGTLLSAQKNNGPNHYLITFLLTGLLLLLVLPVMAPLKGKKSGLSA